jgi:hypothetical protein
MRRLTNALIASVLVLAACTPNTPPPPEPQNDHRATFRWIANPTVDLMSPEGTFIRGLTESWVQAFAQPGEHVDALRAGGYPGFEHAFNNAWDPKGWAGNGYFGDARVGTDYFEVIEAHRDGANLSATVCNYASMTATKVSGDEWGGPGARSGQFATMTFGPDPKLTADVQRAPLPQQMGPARKPIDNVFGTWITTDWHGLKDGDPRCNKLAPGTPADVPEIYRRPDAPPSLPPDPGWPEAR